MKKYTLFVVVLAVILITTACGGADPYQREIRKVDACFEEAYNQLYEFFPEGEVTGPLPESDQFAPMLEQYSACFVMIENLEPSEKYGDAHAKLLVIEDTIFSGAAGLVYWLSRNNNSAGMLEKIQTSVNLLEEGQDDFQLFMQRLKEGSLY